ncbi:MAG: RNA 2',3'-cyclic phosphodiesterase [Candidatus Dormibacteria bacterium]
MTPTRFLAVLVPPETSLRIAPRLLALEALDPAIRAVRPDGMHLTVQFLGRVPDSVLAAIAEVAQRVAGRHPPFQLALDGLGWFGPRARPTSIWLGIGRGTAELAEIHQDLARELVGAGLDRDPRPYRAHCTLARARGELLPAARTRLHEQHRAGPDEPLEEFLVQGIQLLESLSIPGEPNRYRALSGWRLGRPRET